MRTRIIQKSDQDLRKANASTMKEKKAKIVEKFVQLFKNKFYKLFADKGYTQKNLLHDLNQLITDEDLRNFEYNTMIIKVEKGLLEILSKLENEPFKGYDMSKINSLISKHENAQKVGGKTIKKLDIPLKSEKVNMQMNNSVVHSQLPSKPIESNRSSTPDCISKRDKISMLKEKEKDEWALIAKHNYQKHINQEQEKKNKEKELKRLQKEILQNQIREKELLHLKEKEENKNFFSAQMEHLKKLEHEEKMKEMLQKEKILKEKLMHDNMINQSKLKKDEIKKKEMTEDKKILDKIKTDLDQQETKLNQKKIEQREVYRKIILDNESKIEAKKFQKEKEKLENQKALEEYSKLIEKQEEERKMIFENRLHKMRGSTIKYDQNVKKKDEMLKLLEQSKLMREQEEKDKR
jgi:hypothetical protein